MKGARINFGVPNSEYVLLANDNGEAVSLKNQDTNTEYVGGGGATAKLTVTSPSGAGTMAGPFIMALPDPIGTTIASFGQIRSGEYDILLYNGSCMLVLDTNYDVSVSGDISEMGGAAYIITGDCSVIITE